MKKKLQNMEHILAQSVSGFHIYSLTDPVHLTYVSDHLCTLLNVPGESLLDSAQDSYALRIHPEDRDRYRAALEELRKQEQSLTLIYRMQRGDGSYLSVSDTLISEREEDGTMTACSVLSDITELTRENDSLQFLNDTVPCGFMRYTCEKDPRIIYVNEQMRQILGLNRTEGDGLPDAVGSSLYTFIPPEERPRSAAYLEQVTAGSGPIAGEISLQRNDGSRVFLFGWVVRKINEQGEAEFQSACMDITMHHRLRKERETARYISALTEVYDKIFEFNFARQTVKCLCSHESPMFRWTENVAMEMESATDKWIMSTAAEEDRQRLHDFFAEFWNTRGKQSRIPPVIQYRALSSDGVEKTYSGLFLKMDENVSLFCCRCVQALSEAESLRSENTVLKDINHEMKELVMHFTDGLAAFVISDGRVSPLYASENVRLFFGYSQEEWISCMDCPRTISDFVSRNPGAYDNFMELQEKGEAEFTYFDVSRQKDRRVRAVCSRRTPDGSGPRYVLLYHTEKPGKTAGGNARVKIRTFGFFDVFVEDRPIAFRNEKAKELFALLVDRRGGFISSEEAISYLWEDEPASPVMLARYRKVALRLKNTLEEYGIADIVESVNGKRRLAAEKVSCDLFDYLSGDEAGAQLFKGSYLSNYSWSETTLAELSGESLF